MTGIKYNIEVIPGIEFSASYENTEIHILGYFIDYRNILLKKYIEDFRIKRIERIKKIIDIVNGLGYKINYYEIFNFFGSNISPGRPHIALLMVRKKIVRNYNEAFNKFLGDGKIADVKKQNPAVEEILGLIKEISGISFLAHPGKLNNCALVQDVLKMNIDGIETVHPSHSREESLCFRKLALQNSKLMSGGSDYHGVISGEEKHFGKYYIKENELLNMKKRVS